MWNWYHLTAFKKKKSLINIPSGINFPHNHLEAGKSYQFSDTYCVSTFKGLFGDKERLFEWKWTKKIQILNMIVL